jgi:hypothetical protein
MAVQIGLSSFRPKPLICRPRNVRLVEEALFCSRFAVLVGAVGLVSNGAGGAKRRHRVRRVEEERTGRITQLGAPRRRVITGLPGRND